MDFKSQLQADISKTFLNEKEFADWHMIDDRRVKAVVTDIEDKANPLDYAEGVSLVRKLVNVAAVDIGYRIRQEQRLRLDDVRYTVAEVREELGMLMIQLELNEA